MDGWYWSWRYSFKGVGGDEVGVREWCDWLSEGSFQCNRRLFGIRRLWKWMRSGGVDENTIYLYQVDEGKAWCFIFFDASNRTWNMESVLRSYWWLKESDLERLYSFMRWSMTSGGWGREMKSQRNAMMTMGEDAKETECVREALLTFETDWLFLVSVWVWYWGGDREFGHSGGAK